MLRLASNIGKMRFRRSPTFHFSRSNTFFGGAKQKFLDDPTGGGGIDTPPNCPGGKKTEIQVLDGFLSERGGVGEGKR